MRSYCLISGKFSFCDTVFNLICVLDKSPHIYLKPLSTRELLIQNHYWWYALLICSITSINVLFWNHCSISSVPNFILCDNDMKNGSLFKNTMSAIIITLWYSSITSTRISSYSVWTWFCVYYTLFLFKEPMFGLKLPSTARISSRVMGKFGSGLLVIILMKSIIIGIPILSCVFLSNSEWE